MLKFTMERTADNWWYWQVTAKTMHGANYHAEGERPTRVGALIAALWQCGKAKGL